MKKHPSPPPGMRGILAPSIREYWDASSIEAFSFDNSFSMTNKGLEINAQRWRRKDDTSRCLIRLNCGLGAFQRLAIPLLEHVDGTYDRIKLGELYDMTTIRSQEWKEVHSKGPAVIRASNYSSVVTSSSIFTLDYPDPIDVGNKYFVDFYASYPQLKSLDESFSRPGLTPNELIVEPNRLVFINMELRSGASRFQLDVIVNLDERSFPSVGVLARGTGTRRRLGDPLGETISGIYVAIAEELHYQVATIPAYPAIAVDEDGGAVVSVLLLPRPQKKRSTQGEAGEANFATSREPLSSSLPACSPWPRLGPPPNPSGVSTDADHDYGHNKRNNPVARAGGLVPVGKGGEPVSHPNPVPPQAHADQSAGKNTEDAERPHGGGHSHETHTAAGPPRPAPTM
ncbi:hypothetical protein PG991_010714 [Apiospora marii]|uniref:Uncharacterized protein n=1 Tax=Apiospora marii TaxID=335849 RepID=A0ABR1RD61_9PEZI